MSYFIEKIQYGFIEGVPSKNGIKGECVIVSVKYNDGKKIKWLTNVEIDGIPNMYRIEKDIFYDFVEKGDDCPNFVHFINDSLKGTPFFVPVDSYENIVNSFNSFNFDELQLIKTVIYVTRCDPKDLKKIVKSLEGKSVNEISIPFLDVEQDFYSKRN